MTRSNANEQTRLLSGPVSGPETSCQDLPTRLTTSDWLGHNIQLMRLHGCYVAFCGSVALWCILLAIYSGAMYYRHGYVLNPLWFLVSDTALMIFIVAETVGDIVVLGWREYWKHMWHIFDFVVCVFCTLTVVLDLTTYFAPTLFDDYVSMTLLISRYCGRGLRVLWLLKMTQKAKAQADMIDETPIVIPSRRSSRDARGMA